MHFIEILRRRTVRRLRLSAPAAVIGAALLAMERVRGPVRPRCWRASPVVYAVGFSVSSPQDLTCGILGMLTEDEFVRRQQRMVIRDLRPANSPRSNPCRRRAMRGS